MVFCFACAAAAACADRNLIPVDVPPNGEQLRLKDWQCGAVPEAEEMECASTPSYGPVVQAFVQPTNTDRKLAFTTCPQSLDALNWDDPADTYISVLTSTSQQQATAVVVWGKFCVCLSCALHLCSVCGGWTKYTWDHLCMSAKWSWPSNKQLSSSPHCFAKTASSHCSWHHSLACMNLAAQLERVSAKV